MKRLACIVLLLYPGLAGATTWYVRTDGGRYGSTASTCNGQTDAAFTGANGPNCAVNHPFEILGVQQNNPITRRIAGGDTVIIKNGSYKMGYAAGLYDTGWCNAAWPDQCFMAPIPSGSDAAHKTKIYGEGYASCTTKPELWGSGNAHFVLNLDGSSNTDVRCLDFTDHAQCGGNAAAFACANSATNPHAHNGVFGWNGANNEWTDVLIHGFAFEGAQLGKQTDFSATNVYIYGNAYGGLDQDSEGHGGNNSWSGTNVFTNLRLEWNGCSENYPVDGSYRGCTDQNDAGYGDAWGSPNGGTGGNFTYLGGRVVRNTSDGLDFSYLTDPSYVVTVDGMYFEGNVGNPIKTRGGKTVVRNNVIIGNCGVWADFASKGASFSTCRQGGNTVVLAFNGGLSVDVVNNTIIGESDILFDVAICTGGEVLKIQNNIIVGTTQYGGGDIASWLYAYSGCDYATLVNTTDDKNNIIYGVKESTPCSGQTSCSTSNPTLTTANFSTDTFDLRLQAGSPAINAGLNTGTAVGLTTVPTVDYLGTTRPAGPVDLGAYEYTSSTPTMGACSPPAGTVGVAYDYTVPVTGGTTPYTLCDESVGSLPAGSPAFASTAVAGGCQITGTPSGAGTTNFTERVTDSGAQTDAKACSLVVNAAAPTITTTTLPDGIVGFAYSAQVDATGGTLPYTLCDESVGSLPAGNPAFTSTANEGGCLIQGTPTGAGTTNFTERITDSGAQNDTQALSLTVAASLGTITYSVNPGSDSVTIRYGFSGLPASAVCLVRVINATTLLQAGSSQSESGASTRVGVVTGLAPSTSYTTVLSCDVPSGEQYPAFVTFPASSGAQTVRISAGSPVALLPTVARMLVEYGTTTAVSDGTAQDTNAGDGFSVNLSLTAGLYYWRYKWQTAGDVVLATSAVQPLPVP